MRRWTHARASYRRTCYGLQYCGHRGSEAKRNVVTNIPTYCTAAVGQFAGLLLEICHHIGHHSDAVIKDGRWASNDDWCFWDYPLIEMDGKTIGIIGFGRIGQTTGRIAQAFGMRMLDFDANKSPSLESETCKYVDLEELAHARSRWRHTRKTTY